MKYNIQYTCRITYGKFSYFVKEWVLTDTLNAEFVRLDVQRKWRLVKSTTLEVDHFSITRIQEIK